MFHEPRKAFLISSGFILVTAGIASAAPIVWQAPVQISGDSDVNTAGTLVYAENVGDQNVSAETINGVTFTPFDASRATFPTGTATHGGITLSGINSNYNGAGPYTGSGSAPFANLSGPYQALLNQVAFAPTAAENNGPDTLTLTLGGLTIGRTYEFQDFNDDSRGSQGGSSDTRSLTINDGANTSAAVYGNNGPGSHPEGGLGHYIVGTFVASATSETLVFNGNPVQGNAQINAFQLRDVTPAPEPGALSMLSIAAVGLFRRRRS